MQIGFLSEVVQEDKDDELLDFERVKCVNSTFMINVQKQKFALLPDSASWHGSEKEQQCLSSIFHYQLKLSCLQYRNLRYLLMFQDMEEHQGETGAPANWADCEL